MLNELCSAYCLPYLDLASDVDSETQLAYGGRVCVNWSGQGCLVCLGVLDAHGASVDLATPSEQRDRERIYGVDRQLLQDAGPSVVSLNGVVASLAVTEFMVAVTGIRGPQRLMQYYGHSGKVTVNSDNPHPGCWYCKGIRGSRESAELERYFHSNVAATT